MANADLIASVDIKSGRNQPPKHGTASNPYKPRPMPFAYIVREEVEKFATRIIDPATKRKLTGAQRALYVTAYLCIPTSGPEAEKPENERIITEARSKFARDSGYCERTITRGYRALERAGLLEFTPDGRAGPENVYTREWQKFTLPRAPRGHWRVIVPRHVRKQRQREEADRERRKERLLRKLEGHRDSSRIGHTRLEPGSLAEAVALSTTPGIEAAADLARLRVRLDGAADQKITIPTDAGTSLGTETQSPPLPPPQRREGGDVRQSLTGNEASRLRREQVSPELPGSSGARLRRELSPDAAEEVASDWHEKIARAARKGAERRERQRLGLPEPPDDDPDPH